MTALSKARLTTAFRVLALNLFDRTLGRRKPRRSMVAAVALVLAGLSISLLMAAHVLPGTFSLGFVTLVLLAVGGCLLLVRCGEI